MNYHVIIAGNGKGSEEISELLKQEGISFSACPGMSHLEQEIRKQQYPGAGKTPKECILLMPKSLLKDPACQQDTGDSPPFALDQITAPKIIYGEAFNSEEVSKYRPLGIVRAVRVRGVSSYRTLCYRALPQLVQTMQDNLSQPRAPASDADFIL